MLYVWSDNGPRADRSLLVVLVPLYPSHTHALLQQLVVQQWVVLWRRGVLLCSTSRTESGDTLPAGQYGSWTTTSPLGAGTPEATTCTWRTCVHILQPYSRVCGLVTGYSFTVLRGCGHTIGDRYGFVLCLSSMRVPARSGTSGTATRTTSDTEYVALVPCLDPMVSSMGTSPGFIP